MRKVVAVAVREYLAAVRTKAFIASLLLMPIMLMLSVGIQVVANRAENEQTTTYAVIDHTGRLAPALDAAVARHNADHERGTPMYRLRYFPPEADIDAQRLALSAQAQHAQLDGILEIGPDVFALEGPEDDRHGIRLQSEKALVQVFGRWTSQAINEAIQEHRFAELGVSPEVARQLQAPVPQRILALTKKNPTTGAIEEGGTHLLATFFLPLAFVSLMFVTVMVGVVPAMQGVVEEKQQRIAEVLLGCVSPFELMLGKLLGTVAVSLTVSLVYVVGGSMAASQFGVAQLLTPGLIVWFVVFLFLSALTYGSLFIAIGAAANDVKETQSLQTPVVLMLTLPMVLLTIVLRDPGGRVAVSASFVPFCGPMFMTARLAGAGSVPLWQPTVTAAIAIATALSCVWLAGRVFRVGLLMQGQGVKLADLARWIRS